MKRKYSANGVTLPEASALRLIKSTGRKLVGGRVSHESCSRSCKNRLRRCPSGQKAWKTKPFKVQRNLVSPTSTCLMLPEGREILDAAEGRAGYYRPPI